MRKKTLILIAILCIGLLPRKTLAETYDGEYSIDYLIRNYSIVTLGQNDNRHLTAFKNNNYNTKKGDILILKILKEQYL